MNPLTIRIDDENSYFSLGLQLYITDYAREHNKSVRFLSRGDEEHPDVVITTRGRRITHWCTPWQGGHLQLVLIRDRAPAQASEVWREIYRTVPLKALAPLLARLFADVKGGRPEKAWRFTTREKQVMNYLRKGWDQSKAAKVMGVSVKTVHSHKRSVMSKLQLTRSHDFIYWLLSHEGDYS
ncbi:helix-turn-helix transcriptional regulator [Serratia marcescens]|uniref:helix-turn-helix transcriptional regulator n=1 Tax=Serratia TaxID=613 RepID=UPI000C13EE87|nr:helix-turn-helix transcriptional regulator [Serratia marcescens]PHY73296.1 helix-turn-helix transcriptional regulator [Serratia marcescens]PIC08776.1 helix-turn-helix transcriptional regulator [Serratia marcescens]CAI2157184.1 fimbriae regulatory protein FimW [Serratia marcescens]HAT2877832.1 helix-turn-helix transcriptional regulator [Serratia marcescens]HAT2889155.1 helix-turn-helix transcriptional regulator [Serratia marcescens]